MRLGFDIDEVVVDLITDLNKYIENNYGIDVSIENFINYNFKNCMFNENDSFNKKIIKDIIEQVCDSKFQFKCKPITDARETLQKLKHAGHKIFLISSRPKNNKIATIKWLKYNDIPFDDIKIIGQDKAKGFYGMNLMLDMFVDDFEKHLISMWRFKKRWRKGLLLFDKPWNSEFDTGSRFKRVYSWKEILRHIGVQNR